MNFLQKKIKNWLKNYQNNKKIRAIENEKKRAKKDDQIARAYLKKIKKENF